VQRLPGAAVVAKCPEVVPLPTCPSAPDWSAWAATRLSVPPPSPTPRHASVQLHPLSKTVAGDPGYAVIARKFFIDERVVAVDELQHVAAVREYIVEVLDSLAVQRLPDGHVEFGKVFRVHDLLILDKLRNPEPLRGE